MFGDKWHLRFMQLAELVSTWSKDPSTKVGAVIVDKNKVVRGLGYNGFPRGIEDSMERLNDRETKYELTTHAEINAVLNSNGNLDDCVLYVYPSLMVPNICPNCAKTICQTGIKTIVGYHSNELNDRWQKYADLSALLLKEANINFIEVWKE